MVVIEGSSRSGMVSTGDALSIVSASQMSTVVGSLPGMIASSFCFFFQAEDGIRYWSVTGVQTCALPISTNEKGEIVLRTVDVPDSTLPSALAWIQAFPRRLTVAPLERQTVRLLARPPAGLADGEYWVRLVIAAKAGTVPITGVSDTTAIQVGLTLEVRTIIGLSYRKGPVTTRVALSNVRAQLLGDTLVTRSRLVRSGNAAFVGTVRGTVVDSTGATRASFATPLGVYFTMEPRIASAIGKLL